MVCISSVDFGREVLRGVRAWCTEHKGTRMVVVSEAGYIPGMHIPSEPFDCLVIQYSGVTELEAVRKCFPNLVVTSNREPAEGFARVLNDERAIGRMGAEYLMSLGYRTLAFLNPDRLQFARERAAGFEEAVRRAGLECREFSANSAPETAQVLARLMELAGPVAVMAASDLHARWILEALEDPVGVVPGQLAVLGVDDDSLQNALSPIPISTVALSGERIGYEAAGLGMRLAAGEPFHEAPIPIPPKHVIARRSTDAIAIKDRLVARILRLMRERMADFPDAGALIREIGVPRRTLEVRFNKATGQTLAHELASARIQRARELLSSTDLSIKEIAFLVGFSEPRMLSLVFKRVAGELPSEYRVRVRPGH
ncbi:MAG: substrate-binding domain-containing protein [Oceanipulchritudo sp.]